VKACSRTTGKGLNLITKRNHKDDLNKAREEQDKIYHNNKLQQVCRLKKRAMEDRIKKYEQNMNDLERSHRLETDRLACEHQQNLKDQQRENEQSIRQLEDKVALNNSS